MSEPGTVEPGIRPRRWLDWRGPSGRLEFLIAQICGLASGAAAICAARAMWDDEGAVGTAVLDVLVPAAVALASILLVGSTVRRLHDLGLSGAFLLVLLVPVLDVALFLYLLLARSRASAVAGAARGPAVSAVVAVALLGALLARSTMVAVQSFRVSSNEASALGMLRDLASSEYAYADSNHGLYESRRACLLNAPDCIPGYEGPPFLEPDAMETSGGYHIELHSGGPPSPPVAGTSPSSTETFAFTACPSRPGRTGQRSFCTDSTGRVCEVMSGCGEALLERSAAGLRCASSCPTLGQAPAH